MSEEATATFWIPQSKLQPPRLREDVVPRPRLLAAVRKAGWSQRLTLISAPAGYGKTTLLATLAHEYAQPVVWLALDEEDNDPALFFAALVAALRRVQPDVGQRLLDLLSNAAGGILQPRRLMRVLIGELEETLSDPLLLVLDDLHLISAPGLHEALDYLLERMPTPLHVAATTRRDPPLALARLRMRGQLAEFRPPQLRFTVSEALELLNERLHLQLSPDEARSLHTQTEGWVAGLRLVASSFAAVSGAERETLAMRAIPFDRGLFDLLAQEVLDKQPATLRNFLLQSAVLDILTPDLCAALLGEDAPLLLEEVYRRNLFLEAVEGSLQGHTAYRYHALFAEFLRHRLQLEQPDVVGELHRRAAEESALPTQAIHHFLAAEAWDEAAVRIEQVAEEMFRRAQFERLQGWIGALPSHVRRAYPWLSFYMGVTLWGASNHREADRYLQEALRGFQATGDDAGRGEAHVQLSVVHQTLGDFAKAARHQQASFDLPISPRSRTQLHMSRAWLTMAEGDLAAAQRHLDVAHARAAESGDDGALQVCILQTRGIFQCLPDGPGALRRFVRLLKTRGPDELSTVSAAADTLQAILHAMNSDLDAAIEACQRVCDVDERIGELPWLMIEAGAWLLPLFLAIRGDTRRSDHFFARYEHHLDRFPGWRGALLYTRAHAAWMQGRLKRARTLNMRLQEEVPRHEWPVATVARPMLRGQLAISAETWREAERALREALALQRQIPVSIVIGSAQLKLAILYEKQGRDDDALRAWSVAMRDLTGQKKPGWALVEGRPLAPLLERAIAQDIFAAEAQRLLDVLAPLQEPQTLHIAATDETLTPRESEILGLIVAGLSNREIAEDLVISEWTVKSHITRLYAKLDVSARAEAIVLAHKLHLF